MKAHFTSVIFGLLFGLISLNANAVNDFYVTSGQEFKLVPKGPGGAALVDIASFAWKLGSSTVSDGLNTTTGVLTQTITLGTATAAETKTYTLQLTSALGGCLSELVTYTVHVLPSVINGSIANIATICSDVTSIAETLTASTTLTNLPAGISVKYVWKKGTEVLSSVTDEQAITDVGTYTAEATYDIGSIASNLTKLSTVTPGLFTKTVSKLAAVVTPVLSLE